MAIIGSLPITLTNGTVADATQVMGDFNKIVNDVNANAAASADLAATTGSSLVGFVQSGSGLSSTNVSAAINELAIVEQTSNSTDYTLLISDNDQHMLHPSSDNNPRTFTIPANASVAFPVGSIVTFVNKVNTLTIAINSDTLTLAGFGTTGSRSLAANGIATALKISSTEWIISGQGLA